MERHGITGRIRRSTIVATIGCIVIVAILVVATILSENGAHNAADETVLGAGRYYFQQLATKHKKEIDVGLQEYVNEMHSITGLVDDNNLSDLEHLQLFEAKIQRLFNLEKLAFVDERGTIYTTMGTQTNISDYKFDPNTISSPSITVKSLNSVENRIIVAIPIDPLPFEDARFVASFMEIDLKRVLENLSLQGSSNIATYCNLYSRDGISLTGSVLGSVANKTNLFSALSDTEFTYGSSLEQMARDFADGREGSTTFIMNGEPMILCYAPVEGTEWMSTHLANISMATHELSALSDGLIARNNTQLVIIAAVAIALLLYICHQIRLKEEE